MLEILTAVAAILIGLVVLVGIGWLLDTGVPQLIFLLLFGILFFGALAYVIGMTLVYVITSLW